MDDKLWFGRIHIMEWLPTGEQRTGRELHDEIEPMALVSTPAVHVAYHRITTRHEFVATLRKIEDDFRAIGRLPLLQIETDGLDTDQQMKDNIGICSTQECLALQPAALKSRKDKDAQAQGGEALPKVRRDDGVGQRAQA